MKKTVILGIDPGYDRVGWAIATKRGPEFECIALGCIQTNPKETIFERYQKMSTDLLEIIAHFKPTQLAIETLFFSKNKKTALRVSEARGVIINTCLSKKLSVFEYSPVQIKLAVTGNGAANKQAVAKMIQIEIGSDAQKHLDDAVDAVAIVLTHSVTHVFNSSK